MRFFKAFYLLMILFNLMSSLAWAAPTTTSKAPLTVILDISRTFVQEVEAEHVIYFDKKNIITAASRYFVIADHAASVLGSLSLQPGVQLAVASSVIGSVEIGAILKSIPHPFEIGKTMADLIPVISKEQLKELDSKTYFLLTSKDSRWEGLGLLQVGIMPEYLALESAKKSFNRISIDEYGLRLQKQRMAGLYGFVTKVSEDYNLNGSMLNSLEKLKKYAFLVLARAGSDLLNQNLSWVVDRQKVIGCEIVSQISSSKNEREVPLELCRIRLTTHLDWKTQADGGRGCFLLTAQDDVIQELDLQSCAPGTKFVYLWTNFKNKECSIFTNSTVYLKRASQEKCLYNIQYDLDRRDLQQFRILGDGSIIWEPLDKIENYKAYELGPRASFSHKGSYANLLLSNNSAFELLDQRMPQGCAAELKKMYASGETLYSETLYKAAANAKDVKYHSGAQDTRFFHWTHATAMQTFEKIFHRETQDRAEAHLQSLREQAYEEVFIYLRADGKRVIGSRTPKELSLWPTVMYLSENSNSSSSYGSKLLELQMHDDAKVLEENSAAWGQALFELKQKHPTVISACALSYPPTNYKSYGCGVTRAPIYFVVAEDSNIDLITYYECGAYNRNEYFQLLSARKIKQIVFQ